jgi:hypothetical protein
MAYPVAELRDLWNDDCYARAFLRWSRLPFPTELDGQRVIGDLRYDRERSLGFAEIALPDGAASCPPFVPTWVPPREETLEP